MRRKRQHPGVPSGSGGIASFARTRKWYLAAVTVILIVASLAIYATIPKILPDEVLKWCQEDSDCILVKVSLNSCGCADGRMIPINKQYQDYWTWYYENYIKKGFEGYGCYTAISMDPSCQCPQVICANNSCSIQGSVLSINSPHSEPEKVAAECMKSCRTFCLNDSSSGSVEWSNLRIKVACRGMKCDQMASYLPPACECGANGTS